MFDASRLQQSVASKSPNGDCGCCVPAEPVDVYQEAVADGFERTTIRVSGMDCASCAVTLERTMTQVSGVDRAVVNFAAARMDVYHDGTVAAEDIKRAVERSGFSVSDGRELANPAFWRSRRVRMTALSAALFVIGLILHVHAAVPESAAIAVMLAAILTGGLPIFRAAIVAIRAHHLDMNVLMSVATIGAALLGEWPEAASIVTLFAIGNTLQVYAIERTRSAVQALAALTPHTVLVRRGMADVDVSVDAVVVDDEIIIRPGERIAIDGHIIEGSTTVDESPVTGESAPVEKTIGDRVLSGSLNGSGGVVMIAERSSEDSTLQQIVRLVENAQATKAPTEQFVDQFSRIYTPIVVAGACAIVAIGVLIGGDVSTWLYRGLALLIIACPCSLVISTPVTVVSGIGAASRRGILIKGGAALEAAGRIRALALDKTGTLTEGRPVLTSTTICSGDKDAALRLAGALERRSEHPLAHAILAAAAGRELPNVEEFCSIPGRGATGIIDGRSYAIGSPRLFEEQGIDLSLIHACLDALAKSGETPVILGSAAGILAVFGVADAIRPEASEALAQLRRSGVRKIVMLTGDGDGAARRIARELHIEYRASLLPGQKVDAVQQLVKQYEHVGMVGDGINDAPALAAATVSFAMGTAGSDIALESADIALMQDDLRKLAQSVHLSRSAELIIRQNVIASLVIKAVFVLLAPFGLVSLWLAVAADMGTSIGVTINGLRLFRHER